jgi:hypothetical protein
VASRKESVQLVVAVRSVRPRGEGLGLTERPKRGFISITQRAMPGLPERVVVDLLHEMGDGAPTKTAGVSKITGDDGIDAVMEEDRLRLEAAGDRRR